MHGCACSGHLWKWGHTAPLSFSQAVSCYSHVSASMGQYFPSSGCWRCVYSFRQHFLYFRLTCTSICSPGWPWTPLLLLLPPRCRVPPFLVYTCGWKMKSRLRAHCHLTDWATSLAQQFVPFHGWVITLFTYWSHYNWLQVSIVTVVGTYTAIQNTVDKMSNLRGFFLFFFKSPLIREEFLNTCKK